MSDGRFNEPGAVEQSVSSNPLTRWRDALYFACARYVHIARRILLTFLCRSVFDPANGLRRYRTRAQPQKIDKHRG
jgi:hypothetical protein